jgi:hypothetical protein
MSRVLPGSKFEVSRKDISISTNLSGLLIAAIAVN